MFLRNIKFIGFNFTFKLFQASVYSKPKSKIKQYLSSATYSMDRSIKFSNYNAYGFDLDHTIARYNLYNLFKDTFDCMAKYLVEEKGYEDIFKFDPKFCSRGIVLDLQEGNFLKISHDGKILRAMHGTKTLNDNRLINSVWEHHNELCHNMDNIGNRYRIFENFFDMSSSLICAQIIDNMDKKSTDKATGYYIWNDVGDAIKHVFTPDPFNAVNASFYRMWQEDTSKYVYKCNDNIKSFLHNLRNDNKPVFILSSAYQDFAQATLNYVLGEDSEKYFDFLIFLADKPRFFKSKKNFFKLSTNLEEIIVNDLKEDKICQGGNSNELIDYISQLSNLKEPKVLFFGDSFRSDIIASKKFVNWDTVLILEEMYSELCFYNNDLSEIKNADIKSSCSDKDLMPWGSIFQDSNKNGSTTETLLSKVVRTYSNVALPLLDAVADLPIDHEFKCFTNDTPLGFTSGFYPEIPHVMK